jgi:hypothetical protein
MLRILIAAAGLVLASGGAVAEDPPAPGAREIAASLMTRVGLPPKAVLDAFVGAGMSGVVPHALTLSERTKVEAALASLPPLLLSVLAKRLGHLSFLDGIPGSGSGLTSPADSSGSFDITLRTDLIDESLTEFLTNKERGVFFDDGSGLRVSVTGTGTDALTYVLLHEATHIVSAGTKINTGTDAIFSANIWTDRTTLVPGLAGSLASATTFRRGKRIPASKAAEVYDALTTTPFVSLYATAAAPEDFAELVAWHQIARRHDGELIIEISDKQGRTLRRYAPLDFPRVRARFANVDSFLEPADGSAG